MERTEINSVDDFGEDLGAEMVRLSLAKVGFGAKMVRGWFW